MSNGLRVVSVDLKAIRESDIGNMVYYTASDTAEDFAKAILEIDMNKEYDSRAAITELDTKFVAELEALLNNETVG